MILQSLYALYDRLKDDATYQVAPFGYSVQKIAFVVVIDKDGKLIDIQDARLVEGKRKLPRPVTVPGNAKPSGSALNPCFLWDNSSYMLGFKQGDAKPERTEEAFAAFKEKHLQLEQDILSPAFSAACRFLESWEPTQAGNYSVLAEGSPGFGVFQIQGETAYVHEDPAVTCWWQKNFSTDSPGKEGQCLITGLTAPVARLHPKIKGVRNAQSSGAVIVGYNASAYESYGKKQSENAPVSVEAAFRYTTAINALLNGSRQDKHVILLADSTVVFWTDRPTNVENIFARFTSRIDPLELENFDEGLHQQLLAFLRALKVGRKGYVEIEPDPGNTRFHLLALAPNQARLSIRFYYTGTLGSLIDNLSKHFKDIGIIREYDPKSRKPDPEFPPMWLLLAQTARESKEIPPLLSGPLLRAIITGTSYPKALYDGVMRRIRADRRISYARACIIRGFLKRNMNMEVSMSLDKNRIDPAYRLGRLFAALEKTQRDALGALNSSIRDRYYSSASATPRSVLPRLLRTYQHHLAKLEGGMRTNREKLIQEIMSSVVDFPAHLDLADQGVFAIGYYHQMADFFASGKEEKTTVIAVNENGQ